MKQKKRTQKHSLTLLEVSIAILLTGFLLSTLWGLYHRWLFTYQQMQKKQTELHKLVFLKERLSRVIDLVGVPSPKEEDLHFLFTPSDKIEGFTSLCFSYTNEPDPDFFFNGTLRSLLYVNNLKKLCLTTWGSNQTTRTETLLAPISSFSLSYFDLQTNLWREDWPDTLHYLPLWIRLTAESTESIELIFALRHPDDPIFYLTQEAAP